MLLKQSNFYANVKENRCAFWHFCWFCALLTCTNDPAILVRLFLLKPANPCVPCDSWPRDFYILLNTSEILATSKTEWYFSQYYFRPDPSAAALPQCRTGLAVFLKRNNTPLYICLHLGDEGASVLLFVHQAKGISNPPPDSHCCNWVVAMSANVLSKGSGNSPTTKA